MFMSKCRPSGRGASPSEQRMAVLLDLRSRECGETIKVKCGGRLARLARAEKKKTLVTVLRHGKSARAL